MAEFPPFPVLSSISCCRQTRCVRAFTSPQTLRFLPPFGSCGGRWCSTEDQGHLGRCLGESASSSSFAFIRVLSVSTRNGESHGPHSPFPAQPYGHRNCQGQHPVSGTERLEVPAVRSRAEVLGGAGAGGTHPTGHGIQHRPGASKASKHTLWHSHSCPHQGGPLEVGDSRFSGRGH